MENNRIIVCVGHTSAAMLFRAQSDLLRRSKAHYFIHFPGFADIPVLTKFTPQITTCGSEG